MSERADITLTTGGQAIGTLRSASVSMVLDTIEVAAEDEYGFTEVQPGGRAWSAVGAIFVPLRGDDDAVELLKQAMVERSTLSVVVDFGDTTETGTAVVDSISLSGTAGSALEGSVNLTGTGSLT